MGFILPPLLVKNHENIEQIGDDLYFLTWLLSGFIVPVFVVIVTCKFLHSSLTVSKLKWCFPDFPSKPPLPPSQAQLNERNNKSSRNKENFASSLKTLLSNKAFLIHVLACGLNGSVLATIATFLNQFTLHYFENNEEDAGRLGLLLIMVGLVGSLTVGIILDKTKKYK